MAKDYYETLGVSRNASKEDIKQAYKRLAKKHHPDLNKGDHSSSEKFKEINEANRVLSDDKLRANYDQFGTAQPGAEGMGGFDFGGGAGGFDFDMGDMFDMFFGGGQRGRRGRASRGSDLEYELEITLEEAASGVERSISIPRHETCPNCKGSGAHSDSDIVKCEDCQGSGMMRRTQKTPFGVFSTSTTCRKCNGTGAYIKKACEKCDGEGIIREERNIKVKIPAGVEDGSRLRLKGEGEAGMKGGPSGDLYVFITVLSHKIFERKGDDLHIEVPVSFVKAAIGTDIEVPTLHGNAKLHIPAGTQPDTVFEMAGKGVPHLNGHGAGSEMVKVSVEIPKKISKRQKELLEEFEKESGKKWLFGLF